MRIQGSQLHLPRIPHSKSQDSIPSLLKSCSWHRRHAGAKNSTFSEAPLLLELNLKDLILSALSHKRCNTFPSVLPRRPSGFHKLVINQPKPVIIPLNTLQQPYDFIFLIIITIFLIPHQLVQYPQYPILVHHQWWSKVLSVSKNRCFNQSCKLWS